MITFKVNGIDRVIADTEKLIDSLDIQSPIEDVSEDFASIVRSATPPGYSRKLRDSVIVQVGDDQGEVGYEEGVEKAGNPKLDSILTPRTRGRSVLWVHVQDLQSILEDGLDSFEAEAISVLETRYSDQLNGRP